MIYHNITELTGRTSLMRLARFADDAPGRLVAKLESANSGGSVKDRIALAMIVSAEDAGASAYHRRRPPGARLGRAGARLLVSGEPRYGGTPLSDPVAWACGVGVWIHPLAQRRLREGVAEESSQESLGQAARVRQA